MSRCLSCSSGGAAAVPSRLLRCCFAAPPPVQSQSHACLQPPLILRRPERDGASRTASPGGAAGLEPPIFAAPAVVSRGLQRGGWAGKSGSGAAARAGCGCAEMRRRLFPEIQRRIARMVCVSLAPVGVVAPCSPLPSNREGMPRSRPGGPALLWVSPSLGVTGGWRISGQSHAGESGRWCFSAQKFLLGFVWERCYSYF